jgi:signal transduction histidine kinase
MEGLAQSRGHHVEHTIAERLADAQVLVGRPLMARLIDDLLQPSLSPAAAARDCAALSESLDAFTAAYTVYNGVLIMDLATSRPIAWSTQADVQHAGELARRYGLLSAADKRREPWVAGLRRDRVTGAPTLDIVAVAHPPSSGGRALAAAFILSVDLTRTLFPYLDDQTGLGRTGEVILVDADSLTIKDLRYAPGSALRKRIPAVGAQRAARGETGIAEYSDYRGVPVLGAYRYLPSLKWGLVAKVDTADAYSGLRRLAWLTAVLVALVAAGAIAAARRTAAGIAHPVIALAGAARGLADGDLSARAEVVGTDEIAALAMDFNAMAARLQASHEHLEELVRERTVALERSNADLQQFAYVASHDLQEPLRTITGYVELLARRYRGKLDADADDFIAFATDAAARMKQLINDLLTYSRVGTRGDPFAPTDCGAAINDALRNLAAAIEESGTVVTHAPLPTLLGDPVQIAQLFQNLLSNAIKFRSAEPPRIHVAATDEGSDWHFTVRDNGIGLEPQYAERIFLIFQRLHGREEHPGTGIGLAICQRIVDRHGGRIWVTSKLGQGATFHFTLPKEGRGRP